MDIICIDDSCPVLKKHPILKFGESYVATGNCVNVKNQECYIIPGLPISFCGDIQNAGPYYLKSRFIRLPDASADEMAEVVHEAIANLETVLV